MSPSDLLLQWSIAGLTGLVLRLRGRLGLLHATTFYLLFHLLAFCLRPTLLALGGFEGRWGRLSILPDPEHLRQVLWISSAGLVVFALGFVFGSRRAHGPTLSSPLPFDRSDNRALAATALVFALPAVAFAWWRRDAGAPDPVLPPATHVLLPIALLLIVAGEWRWWSLVPFGCVAWWWSSKMPVLWGMAAALLALLCLRMAAQPRQRPPTVAIVGLMVLAAIVQLIDLRPLRDWRGADEQPRTSQSGDAELIARLDWPALAQFDSLAAAVATVPAESPHTRGSHLVETWNSGPSNAPSLRVMRSRWAAPHRNPSASADLPPLGWISDGWISGGWTGVILLVGATGLLLGWAYTAYTRRSTEPGVACTFACAQAFAVLLVVGGGVTLVLAPAIAAAPVFVWRFLAKRLRRAETAGTERELLREEREKRRLLGHALLHPESASTPIQPSRAAEHEPAPPAAAPPVSPASPSADGIAPAQKPTSIERPDAPWRKHGT